MYFSSFMQMASRREYWYPPRLARILWSAIRNFPRQIEICRILARPEFRSIVSLHPVYPFKYLSTLYLVRGLTATERAQCFLHHYRYVQDRLHCGVLREAMLRDTSLVELRADGHACVLTLGPPAENALWEGELALALRCDGEPLYSLQFAIVPGWVLQSQEKDVLVILRIQGVKGRLNEIRAATRTLQDVAPPALLVAALVGIARTWDIREMGGISASSQFSREHCPPALVRTYDDFFVSLGASRISEQFFATPIPLKEKAINEVTNGHKARTRKKRLFKSMVTDEVCRRIAESNLSPSEPIDFLNPPASSRLEAEEQMAG
ncbi:MAG TPA: DUF535 family protein [Acidobacteriaceae bacterium]